MGHHFGLSCMCHEEQLAEQCDRLFHIDVDGQAPIVTIVEEALNKERHWCDGFIYETILCLLVDVLPSKEACIEKMDGFIRVVDGNAVGNAVMELEEEWASILGHFFNPACFLSDVEVSDYEDELQVVAKELRTKKKNFMGNAWDVFCAGVSTGDLGPFRRMMNEDLGWLSENNIEKVASLGDHIATIMRLM